MDPKISSLRVYPVGTTLGILLAVSFALCVVFGLLFPGAKMYEAWVPLLPGVTWISWPAPPLADSIDTTDAELWDIVAFLMASEDMRETDLVAMGVRTGDRRARANDRGRDGPSRTGLATG